MFFALDAGVAKTDFDRNVGMWSHIGDTVFRVVFIECIDAEGRGIHLWSYTRASIDVTEFAFPTEASVLKIFYLVLGNIAKKWTMPIRCWKSAVNQLAIKFADRMPAE